MTKTVANSIEKFVAEVQDALSDLDPTTVADLTENLEADLLDRQLEEGPDFRLGSPKAFAQELKAGAGLGKAPKKSSGLGQRLRGASNRFLRWAKSLSPAWWVIRAFMAYSFIVFVVMKKMRFIPEDNLTWLFLLVLVVASVWLGRSKPKKWWVKTPIALLNILAIIVSLEWAFYLNQQGNNYQHLSELQNSNMLLLGGNVVFGLHAYDSTGQQLPLSSLRDDRGRVIYEVPDNLPKTDVIAGVQGTTLKNALSVLRYFKKDNLSIVYVTDASVKPGTVIGVQQLSDNSGNDYIELTVSK